MHFFVYHSQTTLQKERRRDEKKERARERRREGRKRRRREIETRQGYITTWRNVPRGEGRYYIILFGIIKANLIILGKASARERARAHEKMRERDRGRASRSHTNTNISRCDYVWYDPHTHTHKHIHIHMYLAHVVIIAEEHTTTAAIKRVAIERPLQHRLAVKILNVRFYYVTFIWTYYMCTHTHTTISLNVLSRTVLQ